MTQRVSDRLASPQRLDTKSSSCHGPCPTPWAAVDHGFGEGPSAGPPASHDPPAPACSLWAPRPSLCRRGSRTRPRSLQGGEEQSRGRWWGRHLGALASRPPPGGPLALRPGVQLPGLPPGRRPERAGQALFLDGPGSPGSREGLRAAGQDSSKWFKMYEGARGTRARPAFPVLALKKWQRRVGCGRRGGGGGTELVWLPGTRWAGWAGGLGVGERARGGDGRPACSGAQDRTLLPPGRRGGRPPPGHPPWAGRPGRRCSKGWGRDPAPSATGWGAPGSSEGALPSGFMGPGAGVGGGGEGPQSRDREGRPKDPRAWLAVSGLETSVTTFL